MVSFRHVRPEAGADTPWSQPQPPPAAGGALWFQHPGRSANGPEDDPAHADRAYHDDWRRRSAANAAGRGVRACRGRGGQGTRT
ncbi:hypothetical protein T492DRAFT_860311 [Pavlovales sp. CCMP2436]|nr:hypothetical protein T492DRAFT_860311 [Pavlovales sp. CCMP2436]